MFVVNFTRLNTKSFPVLCADSRSSFTDRSVPVIGVRFRYGGGRSGHISDSHVYKLVEVLVVNKGVVVGGETSGPGVT